MAANKWLFDKRISLPNLVLISVQFIGFVVLGSTWKATTDIRLANLEQSIIAFQSYIKDSENSRMQYVEKFARFDERVASMDAKLGDIRDQLIAIEKAP